MIPMTKRIMKKNKNKNKNKENPYNHFKTMDVDLLYFLPLFCFCVVELFELQHAWDHFQSLRNISHQGHFTSFLNCVVFQERTISLLLDQVKTSLR